MGYHIVRGTFPVYSADIYGCGTMFIMYHMAFCLPLSILSGWNLDYVMCPPKQAVKLGQNYRCVLFPSMYLGCMIMRLGLVSALGSWLLSASIGMPMSSIAVKECRQLSFDPPMY